MTGLLDAIRAEIKPLEQRLGVLREMETLAVSLDGESGGDAGPDGSSGEGSRPRGAHAQRARAGVSPAPAATAPLRRPSAAGGALGAKTQAVLDVLRTRDEWMSVGEIARALDDGSTPQGIKGRLQTITKRGHAEARGATSARRYRATASAPPRPPRREPEQVRADAAKTRDEVLGAVAEHGPAGFAVLVERTRLSRGQLLGRLQELARAGRVVHNDDDRTWQTTESKDAEIARRNGLKGMGAARHLPQLRGRVAAAIAADPGALTEPRLALHLGADREDVALVCGDLLDDGEVALNPDGTYRTASLGGGPTPAPDELRAEEAA